MSTNDNFWRSRPPNSYEDDTSLITSTYTTYHGVDQFFDFDKYVRDEAQSVGSQDGKTQRTQIGSWLDSPPQVEEPEQRSSSVQATESNVNRAFSAPKLPGHDLCSQPQGVLSTGSGTSPAVMIGETSFVAPSMTEIRTSELPSSAINRGQSHEILGCIGDFCLPEGRVEEEECASSRTNDLRQNMIQRRDGLPYVLTHGLTRNQMVFIMHFAETFELQCKSVDHDAQNLNQLLSTGPFGFWQDSGDLVSDASVSICSIDPSTIIVWPEHRKASEIIEWLARSQFKTSLIPHHHHPDPLSRYLHFKFDSPLVARRVVTQVANDMPGVRADYALLLRQTRPCQSTIGHKVFPACPIPTSVASKGKQRAVEPDTTSRPDTGSHSTIAGCDASSLFTVANPANTTVKKVSRPREKVGKNGAVCDRCGARFDRPCDRNKHVRLKHSGPFPCEVPGCTRERGFMNRDSLTKHMKKCRKRLREGVKAGEASSAKQNEGG